MPGAQSASPGGMSLVKLPTMPSFPHVAGVRAQHVLLVAADVGADEVALLAEWAWRAAAWQQRPVSAAGSQPAQAGILQLSRHTSLSGPYRADPTTANLASAEVAPKSLPASSASSATADVVAPVRRTAWLLDTPRERAEPLPFDVGDRDGLCRVFGGRNPRREEGRAVEWLVHAARRLGGSLLIDAAERGATTRWADLEPDSEVDTDLAVYTDVWLTPEAAEQRCALALPGAHLGATGFDWTGPAPVTDQPSTLRDSDRRKLHATIDDADLAVLAQPVVLGGYAVICPLPDSVAAPLGTPGNLAKGCITVEVTGIDEPPRALRSVPWLAAGGVQYTVRWDPSDQADAHQECPSPVTVAERRCATVAAARVVRELHAVIGGLVLDQSGFVLDVADL